MDTGFLAFANFASNSTIGSLAWSNPSNAKFDEGGLGTSATTTGTGTTQYLLGTGLENLPAYCKSGLIVGIEARYQCVSAGNETSVRAFINGTVAGNDKATGVSYNTAGDVWINRGGANDIWGLGNHSILGANFEKSNTGVGVAGVAEVSVSYDFDVLQMKLYYEPALFYAF